MWRRLSFFSASQPAESMRSLSAISLPRSRLWKEGGIDRPEKNRGQADPRRTTLHRPLLPSGSDGVKCGIVARNLTSKPSMRSASYLFSTCATTVGESPVRSTRQPTYGPAKIGKFASGRQSRGGGVTNGHPLPRRQLLERFGTCQMTNFKFQMRENRRIRWQSRSTRFKTGIPVRDRAED